MKNTWIDKEILYDGTQLRSSWIREETGIEGDAIATFIGPADVPLENMVDLEDVKNEEAIFSKSMTHFIAEHFDGDLKLAVARQRILVVIAAEEIERQTPDVKIERRGDDLYDDDRKLSVSIATSSPSSCLIHFAVNIINEGTPLPTRGLDELKIDPKLFAKNVMKRYADEIESMEHACGKVRMVT